jgi:hypothetical protein
MREAIVRLSDEELAALGFGELVSHCRSAGLRDIDMLEDDGYSCIPQIEVDARLDAALLESLERVDDWELVAEKESSYLYLLELTATEVPEAVTEDHEELIGKCDPSLTDRGVMLSLLGSQETIREVLRNYESAGVVPDLCKLGEYDGDQTALDALTDRQIEALETAFEMGFYEVPREVSTEDVAAELDIDAATLSEHLQRAERNFLRQQLVS